MVARTESNTGCWYRIAVRTSVWPMTFLTIARFPVTPYAAVHVTLEIVRVIERQVKDYSPFYV